MKTSSMNSIIGRDAVHGLNDDGTSVVGPAPLGKLMHCSTGIGEPMLEDTRTSHSKAPRWIVVEAWYKKPWRVR